MSRFTSSGRLIVTALALTLSFGAVVGAAASPPYARINADLVCDAHSNTALIRFAFSLAEFPPSYSRLPPDMDGGLSATPPGRAHECALANGRTVRFGLGAEQDTKFGIGGADPPGYVSVWIDRRALISNKQWKPGYGDTESRWMTAILIKDDTLTFCSQRPEDAAIECRSSAFQMKRLPIDRAGYRAAKGR